MPARRRNLRRDPKGYFSRLFRHFSPQYFTSSQTLAHLLRQANGLPQTTHVFLGRLDFLWGMGITQEVTRSHLRSGAILGCEPRFAQTLDIGRRAAAGILGNDCPLQTSGTAGSVIPLPKPLPSYGGRIHTGWESRSGLPDGETDRLSDSHRLNRECLQCLRVPHDGWILQSFDQVATYFVSGRCHKGQPES